MKNFNFIIVFLSCNALASCAKKKGDPGEQPPKQVKKEQPQTTTLTYEINLTKGADVVVKK